MKSLTIVLLMFSLQAVMGYNWREDEIVIRKCTPPKQLEGKFKLTFKSPETTISGTGSVHVDYSIGKSVIAQNIYVNTTVHDSRFYTVHNTTYIVVPSKQQCQKQDFGFLPGSVPKTVRLIIKMGVLHGVRVQIWQYSENHGRDTVTYYVTADKCMFMQLLVTGRDSGRDFTQTVYYHDMKEGIKDSSVFDLPRYCTRQSYYYSFTSKVQIPI